MPYPLHPMKVQLKNGWLMTTLTVMVFWQPCNGNNMTARKPIQVFKLTLARTVPQDEAFNAKSKVMRKVNLSPPKSCQNLLEQNPVPQNHQPLGQGEVEINQKDVDKRRGGVDMHPRNEVRSYRRDYVLLFRGS